MLGNNRLSMAATFARIRFLLPHDRRLNADVKRLPISHSKLPADFELVALESDVITKSGNLVVRSSPLGTAGEASQIGRSAQFALLIAAAKIRLGVDLGVEGPKSGFLQPGLEMVRHLHGLPAEAAVLNDHLGLTLVDASQNAVFAGIGQVQAIIGTPAARFAEAFAVGYSLVPFLTDRTTLALELYSAARFEASLRARFLTLVSGVECVATRHSRVDRALSLVRTFQSQLEDANIDELDRSQLRGSLQDLERRSITGTCKALVAQHCGDEMASLFVQCYHARSKLVHEGHTDFDIGTHIQMLDQIVADTIVGCIAPVA